LFFSCFLTRVCLAFSCNWEGIENWEVFRKLLACRVVEVEGILAFVEVGRRKNLFCGFCFGRERERERESSGWELLDGELGLRKCTSIVAAVTCGTTNIISGRAGFFVFPEVL
jgi:hypothetical protein